MNKKYVRTVVGIGVAALVSVSAAACSSSGSSSSSAKASASSAAPLASIPSLSGVSTAVALDSGFTGALTTLKLTPGVVGTAKLSSGSLIFPITGGNVKYFKPGTVSPYVQGDIQHQGSGFSLTSGATVVQLTNFDINPGTSLLYGDVAVNGKSAATHALLFDLDGRTLKPLETKGNTAILTGTTVHVSSVAAGLLDKTFGTTAVKTGLLVGVATITVNTK